MNTSLVYLLRVVFSNSVRESTLCEGCVLKLEVSEPVGEVGGKDTQSEVEGP